MVSEFYKDTVFFSSLFARHYKRIYEEVVSILESHGVANGLLTNTKDYWARDYMPIQSDVYTVAQFCYAPDYLIGKEKYRTNPYIDKIGGMKPHNLEIKHCPLVVDGGNAVVVSTQEKSSREDREYQYLIMTNKVMLENPRFDRKEIERMLCNALGIHEVIWLPWDKDDEMGHTDGILRQIYTPGIGEKAPVLADFSAYPSHIAEQYREILNGYFNIHELSLNKSEENSWAYIKFFTNIGMYNRSGTGNRTGYSSLGSD